MQVEILAPSKGLSSYEHACEPGLKNGFSPGCKHYPILLVREIFVSWLLNGFLVLALTVLSHIQPLPLLKRLSDHLQRKKLCVLINLQDQICLKAKRKI